MTDKRKPYVVILTTSLLTDRMFLYSDCLVRLAERADVEVWATSAVNPEQAEVWSNSPVKVVPYPKVGSFREFPHNFLRRVNERAWDYRLQLPSRLSMSRYVRDAQTSLRSRCAYALGLTIGFLGVHRVFERGLEILLARYSRSPEAESRFKRKRPDLVVTTGPFWFDEPAVTAHATRLGIPVLAMIPSWDNVTTKNRMVFRYDGFLVWSEQTRHELLSVYPDTRDKEIFVTGATQFDVFQQPRFAESRSAFCQRHGLHPELPIVVYAIGSPHFIRGEHLGALQLAERICQGDLGRIQMLVRPHPTKDNAELVSQFERFSPAVVVQQVARPGTRLNERSQKEEQILDWISTFRHSDVVVNLSSTVTVDAALFDKPVVNVNYDPSPAKSQESLIKDVNSVWSHFRPLAESGGLTLVNNPEELVEAVKAYLKLPELHREQRRWMANYVCGYTDGKCGERVAGSILDFVKRHSSTTCVSSRATDSAGDNLNPVVVARR